MKLNPNIPEVELTEEQINALQNGHGVRAMAKLQPHADAVVRVVKAPEKQKQRCCCCCCKGCANG